MQAAHPNKRVQLWFQDEARFGQQGGNSRVWAPTGSRPRAPRQTEYRYVYLFGAVCPETGDNRAWLMPTANTETMTIHLRTLSAQLAPDVHALLVLDGAGWHHSAALQVPRNVTLWPLPPYAPELNPVETVWRELRQRHLSNRVYADQATLDDAVATAWNTLADDPDRLTHLCDAP